MSRSIRDYESWTAIARSIRMERGRSAKVLVLVEGSSDRFLWSKLLDIPNGCLTREVRGKDNVIRVVQDLHSDESFQSRVIGIVDRDDPDFRVSSPNSPVFVTDLRDMECMICNSDAGYAFVKQQFSQEIENGIFTARNLMDKAMEFAATVGALYVAKERIRCHHDLSSLPRDQYLNLESLETDKDGVLRHFKDSRFTAEARTVLNNYQHAEIARGHDLISFFVMVWQKQRNSNWYHDKTNITQALISNYRASDFVKTQLAQNIRGYQSKYKVSVLDLGSES